MKQLLSSLFLLFGVAGALAQQTAYEALRAVGSQRGQELIGKVLSAEGTQGGDQPRQWDIALQDETARGGVRRFEVSDGVILSEKTPVRPPTVATAMDLGRLNLDSDGAFRLAHAEARKAKIGFDSVNYRLGPDAASGAPYWTLELLDFRGKVLARVEIAATNGVVKSFSAVDAGIPTVGGSGGSGGAPDDGTEGFFERVGRTVKKTGEEVSRSTQKAAGSVRTWSFGRDSNDSGDSDDSDD